MKRLAKHTRYGACIITTLLCGMLALAVGCGGLGDTATSQNDDFALGGLGLTKAEWERIRNLSPPPVTPTGWEQMVGYSGGDYIVALWYDGPQGQKFDEARIVQIGFNPREPKPPMPLDKIEELLPADAQLQETYEAQTQFGGLVAIYHSKSLETRYPPLLSTPDPWEGKEPGRIIVHYNPNRVGFSVSAEVAHLPTMYPPTPTSTPFILLPSPIPTGEHLPTPGPTAEGTFPPAPPPTPVSTELVP